MNMILATVGGLLIGALAFGASTVAALPVHPILAGALAGVVIALASNTGK